MPAVATDLRAAVEASPEDGWGWAVLRGVVGRVATAHGLLRELDAVFAAAPAAVAKRVKALLHPPEADDDRRITARVPNPGDPTAPAAVNWDELHTAAGVGSEPDGPLLFVALMCEYGSAGFRNQKIWMIKGHRGYTSAGLAESKATVEGLIDALPRPGAPAADRQQAVRKYFTGRTELPPEIVRMLDHRLAWFRWAGLELADAWGLTPGQSRELTEDRVWDTSPRVRERALRMARG
jgi:hypothetical protein